MIPMTLTEIADVVDGRVVDASGPVTVTGPAVVDSRLVEPQGLFVAVAGERVDGHDYAASAVEAGAAGVLGARPTGVPTVVVEDPLGALAGLARHVVDSLPTMTVLALTGSQGKTGTKDYLAQVLATAGPTVATAGNFNNEIGVPLTVLRAGLETRYLVVEMGARGVGHIAHLCRIAPPRVAAVLNVGTAHMSEFGSREAIAQAKGEILEALPVDGAAVVNLDDDLAAAMATRTSADVLSFGLPPAASVTWRDVTYDDLGRPSAVLRLAGETARVTLTQAGAHQLPNAAAAAAMALAAGLDVDRIGAALSTATSLSPWRMELTELTDRTVVVNDAYNANPASMQAALEAAHEIAARRGARTVAVLGEMRELGDTAEEAHARVGVVAAELGTDVLVVVGDGARAMVEGAARVTEWTGLVVSVADRAAALAWLLANRRHGDVVLVKASRAPALEWVAQNLIDAEEQHT